MKKTESFQDFMTKQKELAGKERENKKRSLSQDRIINTSRGKITSPSPSKNSKKNSWKQQ